MITIANIGPKTLGKVILIPKTKIKQSDIDGSFFIYQDGNVVNISTEAVNIMKAQS